MKHKRKVRWMVGSLLDYWWVPARRQWVALPTDMPHFQSSRICRTRQKAFASARQLARLSGDVAVVVKMWRRKGVPMETAFLLRRITTN